MNTPENAPAPSSTPRTDATVLFRHSCAQDGDSEWHVPLDFARTLERELADCRRTCAELVTDGNAVTLAESLQRKCVELAEANVQLKDMTDQFFAVSQENAILRAYGLWGEQSSPVANPERGNATGQG